jgi:predicted P-loop ATPase
MDVFTRRVHINGTALAGDAEENRLFARMHADGLRVSRRFVTEAVNSLADLNSFDSLADYFARLEWDGVPRVERFGSVYMGAEDSELGRALDKTWFMGAACRAMYPGSKFDLLPIWQGAQGFGKSTAIRHLCPNPEWFFDGYAIHESAARMMEQTAGKFLCEWSELSGMKTRDIERIKGNVSQVSDTDRLAYGYRATTVARRYVVVGTTNDDKPLRDSANRRFPVRRVLREADTATIRRDRDQLWAEAAHLCREYMREAYADTDRACDREISLPRVWWEAAAKATEEFRDGGVIEDMIEDLVDGVKDGFIRASVLAARLEMKPTQSQDRIIQIMKALGWRKTKLRMPNNARVHVYMIGELEKAQVREIGQLR